MFTRTFVVDNLPATSGLQSLKDVLLYETYLMVDSLFMLLTRELTSIDTRFWLSSESGECAKEITEEEYRESLRDRSEVPLKRRVRKLVDPSSGRRVTVSHFINLKRPDSLKELILVEVYFDSIEEMDSYVPESWFDEEVTGNSCYDRLALFNDYQYNFLKTHMGTR